MSGAVSPVGRRGFTLGRMLAGLALVSAIGTAVVFSIKSRNGSGSGNEDVLTAPVEVGRFVNEVIEAGEVESSSNVEVRCEVQSRNSNGTSILEIVVEGTYVQKGDFLARLDDSALQSDLLQQQIACNSSETLAVQAKNELEANRLALQEYESGTFRQEVELQESLVFVAEENLRRAEEYLRYSERLAVRGYVTEIQLEADKFAVEKARKELDVANSKLEVLKTYNKRRMLNRLQADIRIAESKLQSLESIHTLDLSKLENLKLQMEKCIIRAPAAGQVVYANDARTRSSSGDVAIAEGRLVRERQIMFRLPDPRRMQVMAKINESRIERVKPGMTAKLTLDALSDMVLEGTVRTVSDFPLPNNNVYNTTKEYAAIVEIHVPPHAVRPGMTAEVAIQIEQMDDVLQVPLQAVFERDRRHFCLLRHDDDELELREVQLGPVNEKFAVIRTGLNSEDHVVLNPRTHEDDFSYPTVAPETATAAKPPAGKVPASESKTAAHPESNPQVSGGAG
jgi:multidrug efflux pump subunit AcrA (membrane-fusion protein)